MYILTGLIAGDEFHATIRTIPAVLSRAQSHFFTGSLLLALESLRGRNIVFRNLKPKNVILDAQDSTRFWKESASPPFPIDLASSESLVGMKVDTSSLKWFASPHLRCPRWCCFVAISSLHLWRCLRFSYRQRDDIPVWQQKHVPWRFWQSPAEVPHFQFIDSCAENYSIQPQRRRLFVMSQRNVCYIVFSSRHRAQFDCTSSQTVARRIVSSSRREGDCSS